PRRRPASPPRRVGSGPPRVEPGGRDRRRWGAPAAIGQDRRSRPRRTSRAPRRSACATQYEPRTPIAGWGRPPGARLRPGDDGYPGCPRSCGTTGWAPWAPWAPSWLGDWLGDWAGPAPRVMAPESVTWGRSP